MQLSNILYTNYKLMFLKMKYFKIILHYSYLSLDQFALSLWNRLSHFDIFHHLLELSKLHDGDAIHAYISLKKIIYFLIKIFTIKFLIIPIKIIFYIIRIPIRTGPKIAKVLLKTNIIINICKKTKFFKVVEKLSLFIYKYYFN